MLMFVLLGFFYGCSFETKLYSIIRSHVRSYEGLLNSDVKVFLGY